MNKFRHTKRLSPAAEHFNKFGRYTLHLQNTQGYFDFWDEEKRRCLEGYTTPEGDITITGFHYFYLNYCRIQLSKDVTLKDGTVIAERTDSFPRFYDNDYKYFHAIDTCRRDGKHMVVLKARRKGYSYKAAAMLVRNYFLVRNSKNFVFAGLKEYLSGADAILTKAWKILNFIDNNTAWTQPRLLDHPMEKTSGYKKKVKGQWVSMGMQSSIAAISLKDDPDKVRGKAGELIFFEEAGAFPGLLEAWSVAMPTMRQGSKTLGTMVAFGTGGTTGEGFESLDELFYHPKAYDCLGFENEWSEGGAGTECGYFLPIYEILDGFIDEDGNSLIEEAKEFELLQRAKARTASDPKAYDKYLSEHPFNPEEATLQADNNLFNQATLKEQYDRVRAKNLQSLGVPGKLVQSETGVKFEPDWNLKPILQFPHRKEDDIKGCVLIYEPPFRIGGLVPDNMYFICHDPYAQDKSSGNSLGATYVLKRPNRLSQPDDMIVASYVGRPNTQDEYNSNLFKLSLHYNAKIGFENDRGDVIGYAKRFRLLHRLQPEFEMLSNKDLQSSTVKRGYGMHMTDARKRQGEIYLRDWFESKRGRTIDDSYTLNAHKIYDTALLMEARKFNHKGNYDRCLIGGTQLQTIKGNVPIEEISIGDLVLTHKGRYRSVTKKTHSLSEKLTEIFIVGQNEPLVCTHDHPVLVSHQKKRAGNRHWGYEENQQFEPAEGLVPVQDYVFIPKRKGLRPELPPDEAYIVGWYIGDGHLSKNSFKITFSSKEYEQAKKVAEIVDRLHLLHDSAGHGNTKKTSTIKKFEGYYILTKTSAYVAELFRKYGGTANNKHYKLNCIHSAIGIIEAEGSLKKTPREAIEVGMNEKEVIKHLRQVLIDHGIWSSYRVTNKGLHKLTIPSRYAEKLCQYSTLYELKSKTVRGRTVALETEEGFWTPVKAVRTRAEAVEVFNCEVEEDHTYVSEGFVTHNCMALIIGMYMMQEMFNSEVKSDPKGSHWEWFENHYNGNTIFAGDQLDNTGEVSFI